jgi:hypothetical protein
MCINIDSCLLAEDMCGAPANSQGWFSPHYWHTATLYPLKPSTTYYYVYGSDAEGWSAENSFTSPQLPNPNAPISILAYADMGMAELDGSEDHWANPEAYETTLRLTTLATSGDYAFGLHIGDVSYSTGNGAALVSFLPCIEL